MLDLSEVYDVKHVINPHDPVWKEVDELLKEMGAFKGLFETLHDGEYANGHMLEWDDDVDPEADWYHQNWLDLLAGDADFSGIQAELALLALEHQGKIRLPEDKSKIVFHLWW